MKTLGRGLWRIAKPVLIWLAVQVALTFLALNLLTAAYFTRPRRDFSESINPGTYAWQGALPYQDVTFPARGGDAELTAWYIPAPGATRAVVLVHGKDASRTSEFLGRFLELAAGLRARGFAVLMIDLRGHGKSSDAFVSFGLNERRDVLGAVDWLRGQGIAPAQTGLLGVSMGGAAVLGAMADDREIGAVVTDSAFSDVVDAARTAWTRLTRTPGQLIYPGLWLACYFSGVDIWAARPIDDLRRIGGRPVLLIQGTEDFLVPLAQGRALRDADPRAAYWEVAGAAHGGSYRVRPAEYVERVGAFFERALR